LHRVTFFIQKLNLNPILTRFEAFQINGLPLIQDKTVAIYGAANAPVGNIVFVVGSRYQMQWCIR
jgi:hypothetical protein